MNKRGYGRKLAVQQTRPKTPIIIICQGQTRAFVVELTLGRMWRRQKIITTTRHDKVDDGESPRNTVLLVGLLHQGGTIVLRKGIAR